MRIPQALFSYTPPEILALERQGFTPLPSKPIRGAELEAWRLKNGLSVTQASWLLGITGQHFLFVERGHATLPGFAREHLRAITERILQQKGGDSHG